MKWYLKVLSNYANFNGRASRTEYWYFVLVNVLISLALLLVDGALGLVFGLRSIYSLAVLVPSIAAGVRRMHDVDKSGWFILIPHLQPHSCLYARHNGTEPVWRRPVWRGQF